MASLSLELREALLEGPAGPPAPGTDPNFDNPPNLQTVGRAMILVGWSLAFICFAIRIYTKAFIIRQFRISDYAIILAWALSIGYFPVAWRIGDIAPGIDQWNLQLRDFISLLYWFHIGLILYSICIFFVKLSILRQLLEVFSLTRDYFFWTCHVFIWLNLIYYTILTFTVIFSCRPISKAWDVLIADGTCLNTELQIVVAGTINTLSDLIILVLPHLKIWKLQMPPRRKRAVSVVFLFGVIATTGAALKIHYGLALYNTANNQSYQLYLLGLCTIPEISGGIIAACLPSVPRFFQHMLQTPLVSSWRYSLGRIISASASSSSESLEQQVVVLGNDKEQRNKPKHFLDGTAAARSSRY
ncbi:uncharacterized protein BDV14DRAFT_195733 [Aspergillus stella-maris]|uniref:uncharacterized protein n=1 Tax=Aspergillus stella-maris TaxID=1810926 RepID=UPI003CCE25F6